MRKVSEIRISYRTPKNAQDQPYVKSSEEAYQVLRSHLICSTISIQKQLHTA